jgi:hypothetical protein
MRRKSAEKDKKSRNLEKKHEKPHTKRGEFLFLFFKKCVAAVRENEGL